MTNPQKGSTVSLLIIIIVLLVIASGIYLYVNNKASTHALDQRIVSTVVSSVASTSSNTSNPTVVVIASLNGSFVGNDTWNVTDMVGRAWTINYSDTQFYLRSATTGDQLGNFTSWLQSSQQALAAGSSTNTTGAITVVGTVKGGILYASKIYQHVQ